MATKNENQTENEKLNKDSAENTQTDNIDARENSNGQSDANNTADLQESRPSIRPEAPTADTQGRTTVSSPETVDASSDGKVEETKTEKEEKKAEGPVAGGMKTITDKQALIAREMSKTVGQLSSDDLMILYTNARNALSIDKNNFKNAPKKFEAQRDRSLGTLLACHQAMRNSGNDSMRDFAESAETLNQMNFGISPEDCQKLSSDIANPDTDWDTCEENVQNEKEKTTRKASTITDRQAEFTRAEIDGLEGKDPNELVDFFQSARKEAREAKLVAKYEETPENTEKYDKALAKVLASEYRMRESTDFIAKSTSLSNRGVFDNLFDVRLDDVNELMDDIQKEKNAPELQSRQTIAEEAPVAKEENEYPEEPENNVSELKQEETKPEVNTGEAEVKTEAPEVKPENKETPVNAESTANGTDGKPDDAKIEGVKVAEIKTEDGNVKEIDTKSKTVKVEEKTTVKVEEKKEEKKKSKEKEPAKEEKLTPEQLKGRLDYVQNIFNATVGKKDSQENLDEFGKTIASFEKLSPELKGAMFEKMFREHAKAELQDAINATAQARKNGKEGASFPEVTAKTQEYLKAQFDYFTAANPGLSDMKYPPLSGLQPSEIRDMENKAFLSLPAKAQQKNERKEIADQYAKNRIGQDKAISENFHASVDGLNKEQGVSFSAAGIEKYLAARWKEGAGKDLDSQRENFQKELKEFEQKAYEKMLSKIDGKSDLNKQMASFDNFCLQLETMSKAKGWIDKDAPHAYAGDLDAKTLKDLQTGAVDKLPKNNLENGVAIVDDLCGDKEIRQQAENAKQQKEAIDNIKGKTDKDKEKKKQLQEKAAVDAKNSKQRLKNKDKNFLSEVQKHIDAVPKNPDNLDNNEVRNALGIAKAIETMTANRGRGWRMRHPIKTRMYNNAVKNIMKGLEDKGYSKEVLDHMIHNPRKAEADPISQDHKKQEKAIGDMSVSRDKLEQERLEFEQKLEKSNTGKQITVPEADNIKDIVNPKERSQFIVPSKNIQLQIGGPQQTVQQPKGPTTP